MLDLVFLAMFAVIPGLAWSVYLVRRRHRYALHKRFQVTLGAVLLVAVAVFELEMRIWGWEERASPSRYWRDDRWNDPVHYSLAAHLLFAVPTALLWVVVLVQAWRHFPTPPVPNEHARWHLRWARLAAGGMAMTAITGWVFYWLAFAA
jgi:hypothetical protein